ncbi:unnamed protein product, partial [Sphagnum troendelagicum]
EEDLKQFGQWKSRTPGHPENFETPGVEVTRSPQVLHLRRWLRISNEAASLQNGITDNDSIHASIEEAKSVTDKPTMIKVTTTIGFRSPNKANSNSVHRAALGSKLLPPARTWIGLMNHSLFPVSKHIKEGAALKSEWDKSLVAYGKKYPTEAAEFKQLISLKLPEGLDKALPSFTPEIPSNAIRNLSHTSECPGKNIARCDLCHDPESIGVGEDVPTHQPIEHLASFRAMPNMVMFRPADGNETSGAYKVAVLNHKRPSTLALSRQKLPNLPGTSIDSVALGSYIISDNSSDNKPDLILLGTCSELEIAFKTAEIIWKEATTVRVLCFVCWEHFEEQSGEYNESALPKSVKTCLSIEAGATFGEKYVVLEGKVISVECFGASAPAGILLQGIWAHCEKCYGLCQRVDVIDT